MQLVEVADNLADVNVIVFFNGAAKGIIEGKEVDPAFESVAMKIFLSLTYQDLLEYRAAAANAIERFGQQGIHMEVFGARPNDAREVSFGEIEEADAIVGIYAHRYGYILTGQKISITEQEYEFTRSKAKGIFCLLLDEEHPWPPKYIDSEPSRASLRSFKKKIREQVVTELITTPHDLAFKVASSLGRFLLVQKVRENLAQAPQQSINSTDRERSQVARRVARIEGLIKGAKFLLVNDVPSQMSHVTMLLRDLGAVVTVVTDSATALTMAKECQFDSIISDMERYGIQDEGLRFLKSLRKNRIETPIMFTVGQYKPQLGTPAYSFGITNRVDECLNLLFDILERVRR